MAYSAMPTAAQNAAALEHFIYLPVSQDMVSYLAHKAAGVIRCEGHVSNTNKTLPPTPPATPPQYSSEPRIPTLDHFISNLVERSHVQVPTLMTSLVFLAKLQQRLPAAAKGMKCTGHRIFLASLILAAKTLNDSSPKNKHWARYTAVAGYEGFGFSLTEVNLMEKQLLGLLEWDLRVTEHDLYCHLEPFLAPIRAHQSRQAEKQRLREEMVALEQQQLAYAAQQQQRTVLGASHYYESPRSYSSHPRSHHASSSRRSSRAPSRTPSLSPPTRSGSSASQSSAVSYATASPASINSAYSAPMYEEPVVRVQQYDGHSVPSMVHIPAHIQKPLPPIVPYRHCLPLEHTDVQAAVKKQKSNSIFSRFLPTMSRPAHPSVTVTGY